MQTSALVATADAVGRWVHLVVVEIRVLGPFELVDAEGAYVECGSPQQRVVMGTLALRANTVVPTSSIVQAIWGDSAPSSAAGAVRTYVWRLRSLIANLREARLMSRRPGYLLEIEPDRVDAHRFVALVERGKEAAAAGNLDAASESFDEALGLWRGDILADLDPMHALRPELSRLEEIRLAAMEDRIDVELAAGRHVEAAAELESLTAAYPFRERLWSQRMVALYRAGRQADALAAYQSVRSVLVSQLGVEPSPELRALEHDVLAQAPALRWNGVTGQSNGVRSAAGAMVMAHRNVEQGRNGARVSLPPIFAHTPANRPLVGRKLERAYLLECLDTARSGRFVTASVTGPPGIGKTALARWFCRHAHTEGVTVLVGRADEEADVPFMPIGEAIGHWAAHVSDDELGMLPEPDRSQLARLAPEVAQRLGGRPAPASSANRRELFRAIVRWVGALAARAPAAIVFDDLHWADPATLLAVKYLLRHPPDAGALLVLTYRGDTGMENPNGPRDLLAGAANELDGQRINLAGLEDGDVIDLLASRTAGELDPVGRRFAVRLRQATGGNPLFVHEMIRHLSERGAIEPVGQSWPDEDAVASSGVPSALVDVIRGRLERLPASTRAILRPAAVLGEHFEVPVLSRIAELAEISVVEALGPAVDAGLVAYDDPRADRGAFSHALVREAILAGLPLSERARIHWKAGLALREVSASREALPLGEIARHLADGVRAGEPREAIIANIRAGHQALTRLAFEDAHGRFITATELAETSGRTDIELLYNAWAGRGWAACVLTELNDERLSFRRAAAIAHEQRWPERLATAAVGLAIAGLGEVLDPSEQTTVMTFVEEALAMLGEQASTSRCLLLSMKAVHAAVRESADARLLATRAADTSHGIDDPAARAAVCMAEAWALLGAPDANELSDVLEKASRLEVPGNVANLTFNVMVPLLQVPALQLGDRERFESLRRELATAPWIRDAPIAAACLQAWEAAIALCEGRFSDADMLIATVSRMDDWWCWQALTLSQVNLLARERGVRGPGRKLLTRYLASDPPSSVAAPIRASLAALHAHAGDLAAASHHAGMVRKDLAQLGWSKPFVLRHLAEVAATIDDPGLASDLLAVLEPYSGQFLLWFTGITIQAAADRAIGQVLIALGRLDEAVESLEAAQAFEAGFGAHALVARTSYWNARARLKRDAPGDREGARKLLDQTSTQARKLGMRQLERDAEALELKQRPTRMPEDAAAELPAAGPRRMV